jgi:uncharacterized protein YukE
VPLAGGVNLPYIVKVSQSDFKKAIESLQSAQLMLEEYKTAMQKKYSALRADWAGEAGAAYEAYCQYLMELFTENINS